MTEEKSAASPIRTRDEWEIKDDLRAVKRTIKIFKDKDRLKDVQDLIKADKVSEASLDAVADGDIAKALGL